MKSADDGGTAFPRSAMRFDAENPSTPGMTLRDYFAAKALSGLIHHYQSDQAVSTDPLPDLAMTAYGYADAMIAQRKKLVP